MAKVHRILVAAAAALVACAPTRLETTARRPIAARTPELPTPTQAQADTLWRAFELPLQVEGLTPEQEAKVRDAWQVARCIVRHDAFWLAVDSRTADRSRIVRQAGPGVALRRVAARQFLRWQQVHGGALLRVRGIGLDQRPADELAAASTLQGGHTVFLRRWRVAAPLGDLAVTLLHEWLHTLGFADPLEPRDPVSVVYGMEATALQLAGEAGCGEAVGATYIEAGR